MIRISKAEFDALPASLKTKFTADGDSYVLTEAPVEDVEGLKRSKAEILAEKKKVEAENEELRKFKAEQDAAALVKEQKELEKKGEYDKLLETKQKAFEERLQQEAAEREKIQGNLKAERWRNYLAENGIKPERLKALEDLNQLFERIELANEPGFPLKLKDGVGDANELTEAITKLKTSHLFLTDSKVTPGGGASTSVTDVANAGLDGMNPMQLLDQANAAMGAGQ